MRSGTRRCCIMGLVVSGTVRSCVREHWAVASWVCGHGCGRLDYYHFWFAFYKPLETKRLQKLTWLWPIKLLSRPVCLLQTAGNQKTVKVDMVVGGKIIVAPGLHFTNRPCFPQQFDHVLRQVCFFLSSSMPFFVQSNTLPTSGFPHVLPVGFARWIMQLVVPFC